MQRDLTIGTLQYKQCTRSSTVMVDMWTIWRSNGAVARQISAHLHCAVWRATVAPPPGLGGLMVLEIEVRSRRSTCGAVEPYSRGDTWTASSSCHVDSEPLGGSGLS